MRRAASTVEGLEERKAAITNHLIFASVMLLLPAVMLLVAVRDYQKINLFLAGGTEQTVTITELPDTYRGSKGRTRAIQKVVIDGVPVRIRFVNYDVEVGDRIDILFDRGAVQRLASSDYRYFDDFIIGKKADGLFRLMRRQYGESFTTAIVAFFGLPLCIGLYFLGRFFRERRKLYEPQRVAA